MFRKLINNHQYLIRIILLVLVGVFAFWASDTLKDGDFISNLIRKFGYGGIFLMAVVSGFNLVIPIPAISFLLSKIASKEPAIELTISALPKYRKILLIRYSAINPLPP